MNKYYAPEIVRAFIEENKANIKSVDMGMVEDWFYTAETVFEDGKYFADLTGETVEIAGIESSYWATPIMRVTFLDEKELAMLCWKYLKEEE